MKNNNVGIWIIAIIIILISVSCGQQIQQENSRRFQIENRERRKRLSTLTPRQQSKMRWEHTKTKY